MSDFVRAFVDRLDELNFQIAELQRKLTAQSQTGKVVSYDPKTDKAVVDLGFKTHEIPQASRIGDWSPLDIGQMVNVHAPGGDLENAFLTAGGYHEGQARPSNRADERVMSRGKGSGAFRARQGGVVVVEADSHEKLKLKIGNQYFQIKREALIPTSGD